MPEMKRLSISFAFRRTRSESKSLTFTSPPNVPRVGICRLHCSNMCGRQAKQSLRSDYSHSKDELLEIVRENASLIDRLSRINSRPSDTLAKQQHSAYTRQMTVSHASINRRKEMSQIERENMRLFKRLQRVQPCKEIRRDVLSEFHKQNTKYLENCSTFRLGKTKQRSIGDQKPRLPVHDL